MSLSEINTWPNFFLVGAAKSGTTTFARYLAQHPSIGMSLRKEPNYFVFAGRDLRTLRGPARPDVLFQLLYADSITDETSYLAQYSHVADCPVRGDASVRYLYYQEVPWRIREKVSDAKIIILLRNPVMRLWSHYVMMRTLHLEPASLECALRLEEARMAAGWDYDWHYVNVGLYLKQVARYLDTFGAKNVLVGFYEDFVHTPAEMVRAACRFLGVSDNFVPKVQLHEKPGYDLRSPRLDQFLFYPHRLRPLLHCILRGRLRERVERLAIALNRCEMPKLADDSYIMLRTRFAHEFPRLEELVGRPLPASW
jgi:hypothetical protein